VRLTDVVTAADAAALHHPSCRPLVRGLLAVIDDPATGADGTRHAWVGIDLLAPIPLDEDLAVTPTLTGTARLGTAAGLWIDVDVAAADGTPLVRSRHVVAATLAEPPAGRGTLPSVPRTDGDPAGTLTIDAATLAAYRQAAGDTSPAHVSEGVRPPTTRRARSGGPIVPGLLALWTAIAALDRHPAHIEARFRSPLPVGTSADVVAADSTLALRVASTTVLSATTR
jgi:acyl dehydratase